MNNSIYPSIYHLPICLSFCLCKYIYPSIRSPFTSLPCSLPAMTRSLPQAANSRVQGSALVSVCQTKPQPNGRLCRLPLRAISNLFCVILFASSVPLCDQLSYCNSEWVQYWSLCHILFEQTTFPHRLILMVYKR